jgi:hypothetical protein
MLRSLGLWRRVARRNEGDIIHHGAARQIEFDEGVFDDSGRSARVALSGTTPGRDAGGGTNRRALQRSPIAPARTVDRRTLSRRNGIAAGPPFPVTALSRAGDGIVIENHLDTNPLKCWHPKCVGIVGMDEVIDTPTLTGGIH